jgi:hypothetical protein
MIQRHRCPFVYVYRCAVYVDGFMPNVMPLSRAAFQASARTAGSAFPRSHARTCPTAGVPKRENLDCGRIWPDTIVQVVVNSTQMDPTYTSEFRVRGSCPDSRLKGD